MSSRLHASLFNPGLTLLDETWHRSFHRLIFRGSRYPLRVILPLLSGKKRPTSSEFIRRIRKELDILLEQDIQNVKDGYYPKSALNFPLFSYIQSVLASGPLDAMRVFQRAKDNNWQELPSHIHKADYPDYYLRNFHWQTDGWFSEASAKRYDASVQFLFGGAADIMRRMSLPPVARSLQAQSLQSGSLAGKQGVKILELACGTGSFMAQIQAAFPTAELYGIDLSPDYILHAQKQIKGHNTHLLQANADDLPFTEATFDAVICNNLFHELPPEIRRKVFNEVHRVLKYKAVFSITDSAQLGDNPELKSSIENFRKDFHKNYIGDDLKGIFEECGFEFGRSRAFLFSKAIYGVKNE